MAVAIRTAAWLKELLGGSMEVKALGATVRDAFLSAGILETLGDGNGGEDIAPGSGIQTSLHDGDVVSIIIPIAGGAI